MIRYDVWRTSEPEELQDYRKRSRGDNEMCRQRRHNSDERCGLPLGHKGPHEWAQPPAWETQR